MVNDSVGLEGITEEQRYIGEMAESNHRDVGKSWGGDFDIEQEAKY